jgi:hypothetical protein
MGLLTEGWQKRLAVPIQSTAEALTDFSAVLTDSMLPSVVTDALFDATDGALTSGGDLRASVDPDGDTLVGLDLRRWNKAAGEVEIAFRVPQTSAVLTTTLYLWWGKTGATQPATGGVGGQHSAYDDATIFCAPVGGGANRTAFNITGTDVGGITAGDIAAPSGLLGTQHTDVGDYSTYGDNPDLDLVNTDWTMSFLFRATTSGQEQYILGKYDHTTQNRGYLCIFSAAQHFDLTYQPVRTSYNPIYRLSSGVDVVDGQWHHLAGTFISGTRASVYTDGILRNTTTNNIPSSVASNNAPFQIGTQVTAQNRPADFSHVTVHSVARSAEWVKAENDNFRAPAAFFGTFSSPEDVFATPVTVNPGVGTSNSQGFDPTIQTAAAVTLNPGSGTATIQGFDPTVQASAAVTASPGAGAATIQGFAPTIQTAAAITLNPGAGAATIQGFDPTVQTSSGAIFNPGVGTSSIQGLAPTVQANAVATSNPGAGSADIQGLAPTVQASASATSNPGVGTSNIQGFEPTVQAFGGEVFNPGAGAAIIQGFAPTVQADAVALSILGVGTAILQGLAPTVQADAESTSLPGVGSAILQGLAPLLDIDPDRVVIVGVGQAAFQGFLPGVVASASLLTGTGQATLSGGQPSIYVEVAQGQTVGFYQRLRDSTAGPLISRFGREAILRKQIGSYSPQTGALTSASQETSVFVVQLPRGTKSSMPEFSQELISLFDQVILISAKETAASAVEPKPSDEVVINGQAFRVVAVAPVAPSGVSVMYKAGIAGGRAP